MFPAEKILSRILKGGLLLVPFIPLLVTRSMVFPFITGKNFAFRILIEILAVFWLWLILTSPRFRPKFSWLAGFYAAFVAVLALSTIFGVWPYNSFWSSFERMEGFFGHLHLFLYFVMLGSVFTNARDWRLFFNTSVAVSAIITLYAFSQLSGTTAISRLSGTRLDAALGNAIYLAVYLLFHLFIIAVLFFQTKKYWLRWAYAALFLLEAIVLYQTSSRGPLLGFLVGAGLFTLIFAFLERGRIRKLAIAALVGLMVMPLVVFFLKDAHIVRSNEVLARFVNVTNDPVIQGRFTLWNMAFRAWQERPLLGWGQENFIYIFSKYYEPSLWRNEPWFDRAHNVFLDWLTASGALGLGLYLSIFGTAIVLLYQTFRQSRIERYAFAGFSSLLGAHFFQNLFVFDNITSYILFFTVLAYAHSAAVGDGEAAKENRSIKLSPTHIFVGGSPLAISAIILAAVALGYSIFSFTIRPIMAARSILRTIIIEQRHEPAGKIDALVAEMKPSIAMGTFGTKEVRERAYLLSEKMLNDIMIAPQDKQKYFSFAVEELEKQVVESPYDMRAKAQLATAYAYAGFFDKAIVVAEEALKVSDKRQAFYFIAAEAHLRKNEYDKAIEALSTAYRLDPLFSEAIHNLVAALILAGRADEAEEFFQKNFPIGIMVEQRYAAAYLATGNIAKAIEVLENKVTVHPDEPEIAQRYAELGSAYLQLGDKEKAIASFQKAIEREPRFKKQGEQIIKQIQDNN